MKKNLDRVRQLAKDLNKNEPRPAHQEFGGFQMAARTLDKCRAALAGCHGDFTFGCPMDQAFFSEAGIRMDEFRDFVATGASDEEVERWICEHANSSKGTR